VSTEGRTSRQSRIDRRYGARFAAFHLNIARVFYMVGLNCTIAGVGHVHAVDGLVIAVGIAAVAFAAVDAELELSPPATRAARACAPRLRVT
jgi:hypothetical protein